jgi:putative endonuclease
MKFRYYVYIIKSDKTGKTYTGFTENLNERINQHNAGISKYTKDKGPWQLIWFAAFNDKEKALTFEKYLKSGSGYAFARKRLI